MKNAVQSRKSVELEDLRGGGGGLEHNVCDIECTVYVTCSELALEILVGGVWCPGTGVKRRVLRSGRPLQPTINSDGERYLWVCA
jgi:hypothetical protein